MCGEVDFTRTLDGKGYFSNLYKGLLIPLSIYIPVFVIPINKYQHKRESIKEREDHQKCSN